MGSEGYLISHPGASSTPTFSNAPAVGYDSVKRHLLEAFLQRFDRPQTRRAYRNDLVDFFGTSAPDLEQVRSIRFLDVNRYLDLLETEGARPATLKRRLAAIRGFFEWLSALGAMDHNPTDRPLLRKISGSRKTDRAVFVLTATQARGLLDAALEAGKAAIRDHALISMLLHCVLRRSEAASMNVEHIRPLGRYWILDLPETKGGTDQYVKIPAHVVDEIDVMKRHYDIQEGPLWRSLSNRRSGDNRLTAHSIYRIVKQTAARAGLSEHIGAHTLRHTGCTLAIEAGASLAQVQTHARHKKIETTMVYVHQRDKLRDNAADFIHV